MELLLEEISLFTNVVQDFAEEEQQQEDCWDSLRRASSPPPPFTLVERRQSLNCQSAVTRATENCRQAAAELESLFTDI